MTLLHTSDLHFHKKHFEWISQQEHRFDLFCITGDFIDTDQGSLDEQIDWVIEWFSRFKKPLFICSGNHDIELFEREDWLSEINSPYVYIDNKIHNFKSLKVGCYPYIGGDGYYEFDECDILLHHVPPSNTKTATLENGNDWGDTELYDALKRKIITPKIILSGHVHSPKDTIATIGETTIYNPGYSIQSDIPNYKIIEFDS